MGALLWDFDQTLAYRDGGRFSGALVEVIRDEHPGTVVRREQISERLKSGFPWHTPEQPHPHIRSADAWWEMLYPVLENALAGVGLHAEDAARLARRARTAYVDPQRWRLYDDTLTTLRYLSWRGWRHVILSNHVPELPDIVAALGLHPLIDRIFNSAETGYEKPNPQAFRAVLDRLAGKTPVWMIGDSLLSDVRGAEAVGIPGILVRRRDPSARYCCGSLAEVAEILQQG